MPSPAVIMAPARKLIPPMGGLDFSPILVFLLIGGLFGLLVGLTRWPEIHLLEADAFYQVLTGHGINVLIFWIIFFEMAVLQFCSSTLLGCRIATPKLGWAAWGLMVLGALLNNYAVLWKGNSSVMMTSYAPMQAAPSFYLGLILFAIYLVLYLGFVLINAIDAKLMETIVLAGLNLAIVYGMALIVVALLMALIRLTTSCVMSTLGPAA